ncbi:hypothetical protein D3C79_780560 [compost metagenome]
MVLPCSSVLGTRRLKLGTVSRAITTSVIFLMSQARSLLFLPSLAKPLEASTNNTSLLSRLCLSTRMTVGMPVPKKMLDGKPMMVSR